MSSYAKAKPFLQLTTYIFALLTVTLTSLKVYNNLTKGKCKSKVRLDGKVALITGGNSGIGLETARDLARRGARVIIASRDMQKSALAVKDIKATTGNNNVECRYLDLAKFSNVRTFAEDFNKSFNRLDILVNNSGTLGLKHRLTEDGIDIVTQINYFGPFLLTNLLLEKLIASQPSRIIIVSSIAHHYAKLNLADLRHQAKTPWYTIYANTKLYNVLWAKALAQSLPDGVTVNALHPGIVKTEFFNRSGHILGTIVVGLIGAVYKSAVEGAQTTIHLAVADEVKHVTGRYFVDCAVAGESKMAKDGAVINNVWEQSLDISKSAY